ncbi:hypothetical protein TUZN_1707 [Thermoproteus uzoniensis 768-20]|uniref:Uncharacterized protein n=1 Tax=Thermoproteus uzoniensis (strain 768-20) TaxID=999630 RepID=F2L351_THEU7|nr:hypothetical protein TUZN_1707 [Thermoproteus uzoniensis 768-20]
MEINLVNIFTWLKLILELVNNYLKSLEVECCVDAMKYLRRGRRVKKTPKLEDECYNLYKELERHIRQDVLDVYFSYVILNELRLLAKFLSKNIEINFRNLLKNFVNNYKIKCGLCQRCSSPQDCFLKYIACEDWCTRWRIKRKLMRIATRKHPVSDYALYFLRGYVTDDIELKLRQLYSKSNFSCTESR